MNYKFTIIIPHYNIPHLLERLLKSIPVRSDLQIIVIDDCSTQDYGIKLEDVKKKFPGVEYYTTGINGGGGKARNIGLKHAKGEYILFADADDYFTPELEEIFNSITDEDIIFFNANSIYLSNQVKSNRTAHLNLYMQHYKYEPNIAENELRFLFGEPWCKIVKNDIVQSNYIKFDETRIHNDTLFSYLIGFYANNIKVLNKVGYIVTDRVGSVSKLINWDNLKIRVEVFAKKNQFFIDHDIRLFDDMILYPFSLSLKKMNIKNFIEFFKITACYGSVIYKVISKLLISKFEK